jgi:hypothetical protein
MQKTSVCCQASALLAVTAKVASLQLSAVYVAMAREEASIRRGTLTAPSMEE